MGLFDAKFCAVCGNKKGLLGVRLKDGNHLCGDCASKRFYQPGVFSMIEMNVKPEALDMTLEEYNILVERRAKNLELLKEFEGTKFTDRVQIDEDLEQVIFVDKNTFNNKEKLYELNPPVFEIEKLGFSMISTSKAVASTTITGKAKSESTVYLIVGFEDPVYDVCRIEIGKIEAKEGFLGNKVTETPDIQVLIDTFNSIIVWQERSGDVNENSMTARNYYNYWSLMKRAKTLGYVTQDDITETLREFYGRDKATIKEIKKQFNL